MNDIHVVHARYRSLIKAACVKHAEPSDIPLRIMRRHRREALRNGYKPLFGLIGPGMFMSDAINYASLAKREFYWLDTKRSATLDRKWGGMYTPGVVPVDRNTL